MANAREQIEALELRVAKLNEACDEMKEVIKDFGVPEGIVRRYTSFEVAEFILNGSPLE